MTVLATPAQADALLNCLARIPGTRNLAVPADFLRGASANSRRSCDAEQRQCCDKWTADIFTNGTKSGEVFQISDTYESVRRAVEAGKKDSRQLCAYFGPSDSACHDSYGAPRCVGGTASEPDATSDEPTDATGWSDRIAQVVSHVQDAVSDAQGALQRITELRNDLKELAPSAGAEPLGNVGRVFQNYANTLADGVRRGEALRGCLQSAAPTMDFMEPTDDFMPMGPSAPATRSGLSKNAARLLSSNVRALDWVASRPLPKLELTAIRFAGIVSIGSTSVTAGTFLVLGPTSEVVQPGKRTHQLSPGSYQILFLSGSGSAEQIGTIAIASDTAIAHGGARLIVEGIGTTTRQQVEFDVSAPDQDGDGVPDDSDQCPTTAGPANNEGCPWGSSPRERREQARLRAVAAAEEQARQNALRAAQEQARSDAELAAQQQAAQDEEQRQANSRARTGDDLFDPPPPSNNWANDFARQLAQPNGSNSIDDALNTQVKALQDIQQRKRNQRQQPSPPSSQPAPGCDTSNCRAGQPCSCAAN